MKKCCAFLSFVMLLCLAGCGTSYSGEVAFGKGITWSTTMMEAYDYVEDNDLVDEKPSIKTPSSDETNIFSGNYTFRFNDDGQLTKITFYLGMDPAAPTVIQDHWMNGAAPDHTETDKWVWYRKMDGVNTDITVAKYGEEYDVQYIPADMTQIKSDPVSFEDYYEEGLSAVEAGDLTRALDIYDFLDKAAFDKADHLSKQITLSQKKDAANEMKRLLDEGDCEAAWLLAEDVKSLDPELFKDCAYQVAVKRFDLTSMDAMTTSVKMMHEHCPKYKEIKTYDAYLAARNRELTDMMGAKADFEKLPEDFLDVSARLATLSGLEKWAGTFVCTTDSSFVVNVTYRLDRGGKQILSIENIFNGVTTSASFFNAFDKFVGNETFTLDSSFFTEFTFSGGQFTVHYTQSGDTYQAGDSYTFVRQ